MVVLLSLAGCMSWHRRELPVEGAAPVVSGEHRVRVTRGDHSTLVLERAQVVGDSLVGEVGTPPQRVAVALTDVAQVEERRLSALRTTGVVAGTVVVTGAVLVVAAFLALMADWQ